MFTAIAVLQLAERGKIRLDDTVGHYLAGYPNKQVAAEVTVRQLLNHTAGAGGIWGPEYEAHRLELRTLEDYERLNGSRGPDFPPGSKFQYSNYGFILLGLIIEKVSGQTYYDYVQQHIYSVAGMNATGSEPEDVEVPARANGYTKSAANSGEWQSTSGTLSYRGTSAGGGYSTANDLLRFGVALSRHRLLSKRWSEILTTPTVDTEWPGVRYACGFEETFLDGVRWIGHQGGDRGENAEFFLAPATDDVLIVLSNIDPPSANTVAEWIARHIPKWGRSAVSGAQQTTP
jgi:CubicO group peptidase (beta-lactamase class C family)